MAFAEFEPTSGWRLGDARGPAVPRMEQVTMLIGLDWGAQRLRGFVMDSGRVVDRHETEEGTTKLDAATFSPTLDRFVAPWFEQYGPMPVIACGAVGGPGGWIEAPYLDCPVDASEIAMNLTEVRGDVWIVPGLCYRGHAAPDVLHGEETRLIGEQADGLFIVPGYRSRWAVVDDGCIVRFATFMSGELHALLSAHGSFPKGMTDDSDMEAFDRGVRHAMAEAGGGLLNRMFSVHTLDLFKELPRRSLSDYLRGIIIGTEIAEGSRHFGMGRTATIVGGNGLVPRYRRAMAMAGMSEREGIEDSVAHGLAEIAVRAVMV